MLNALCKKIVPGWDSPYDPRTRERGGNAASIVGVFVNLVLFAGKFIAGVLSASIALQADAFNNLSDAGSSVISLLSFKLASRPADEEHPFGHARYEYLASMVVAVLILLLGYELIQSSIEKIISPGPIAFSWLSVGVLVASIGLKLYLYLFYTRVGRHIGSPVLEAASADSISDVLATSAVLLSTIISPLINFQLDGYIGVAVAVFIIITAIKIIIQALNDLLGGPASSETVNRIVSEVHKHEGVLGIHDLIVHDYGPGKCFATMHVEVSAEDDILKSHDMIDNIERELQRDLGIQAVIHMDPIVTNDPRVNELHDFARGVLKTIDPELTLHDVRVVMGSTHSNCIFDVLAPYDCRLTDEQLKSRIEHAFKQRDQRLFAVVTVDRTFVDYQATET